VSRLRRRGPCACQNPAQGLTRCPELALCSFASSFCSWSGCSADLAPAPGQEVVDTHRLSRPTALIRNVYQLEDLAAWSAEVDVGAAGMAELADTSRTQSPLVPGNISCAKFDPGATERGPVTASASRLRDACAVPGRSCPVSCVPSMCQERYRADPFRCLPPLGGDRRTIDADLLTLGHYRMAQRSVSWTASIGGGAIWCQRGRG
jgi:hypothetical protein